jgi:hypothetical protein
VSAAGGLLLVRLVCFVGLWDPPVTVILVFWCRVVPFWAVKLVGICRLSGMVVLTLRVMVWVWPWAVDLDLFLDGGLVIPVLEMNVSPCSMMVTP